tara:strand:- start:86 stop:400 length:315 start_codon:yes stop_codon:yes gene_type:complete
MKKHIDTFLEIGGVEHDVRVTYDLSPPEPDVGAEGGLEITGAYFHKRFFEDQGCLLSKLSDDEFEALEDRVVGTVYAKMSDDIDERADWAYEQKRDSDLDRMLD